MLTGLDISTVDEGHIFGRKAEYRITTRNIGGWKGYIQEYQKTGTVNQREHATFLNMWLEKFMVLEFKFLMFSRLDLAVSHFFSKFLVVLNH
jgi:hypothetical protein